MSDLDQIVKEYMTRMGWIHDEPKQLWRFNIDELTKPRATQLYLAQKKAVLEAQIDIYKWILGRPKSEIRSVADYAVKELEQQLKELEEK